MKMFSQAVLILVLLVILVVPLRASAAVSLAKADLLLADTPSRIHAGADGRIYIIDDGMDTIWRINPSGSSYAQFYMAGVRDAMPDTGEKIWYTDGAKGFGYIDTHGGANQMYSWTAPEIGGNTTNLGPLVVINNQVWMATWFSTSFGVYQFSLNGANGPELCHYPVQGGAYASSAVEYGGRLWWLHWSASNGKIMSLSADGSLEGYYLNRPISQRAGLTSQGGYLWWAEDTINGKIARFNPSNGNMTTYTLPLGTRPVGVTALNGGIWYTDASGTFGRLDPDSAGDATVELNQTLPVIQDPTCQNYPMPQAINNPPVMGNLSWSTMDSTITNPRAGLAVYSLPSGIVPLGITALGSSLWIADDEDPGKTNKVLRFDVPANYGVFLPAIRR